MRISSYLDFCSMELLDISHALRIAFSQFVYQKWIEFDALFLFNSTSCTVTIQDLFPKLRIAVQNLWKMGLKHGLSSRTQAILPCWEVFKRCFLATGKTNHENAIKMEILRCALWLFANMSQHQCKWDCACCYCF